MACYPGRDFPGLQDALSRHPVHPTFLHEGGSPGKSGPIAFLPGRRPRPHPQSWALVSERDSPHPLPRATGCVRASASDCEDVFLGQRDSAVQLQGRRRGLRSRRGAGGALGERIRIPRCQPHGPEPGVGLPCAGPA